MNLLQWPTKGLQSLSFLQPSLSPATLPGFSLLLPHWDPCTFFLLDTSASGPLHCCLLFQESSWFDTTLVPSPTSFILLINVIILVRQCHASSLFCLICFCCTFHHMTYFFIGLFSVGLQVQYMLLKRRDGVQFNFTVTAPVLRCKLYLLSKCSSWCPS